MDPKVAQKKYDEEWKPLNAELDVVRLTGDRLVIKSIRQRLSALSIKYKDRLIKPEVEELYPECVKLAAIAPLSQQIGEFLSESDYILCKWCDLRAGYHPVTPNVQTMLAEHFDIDMELVEKERQHILDNL